MSYTVFVRNWWRWESTGVYGKTGRKLVPDPRARRTKIATVATYEEARDMCGRYNAVHKPGPLSRKAEFTATENY